MLRDDLMRAEACAAHRGNKLWYHAFNWPGCSQCEEILIQVANSCSHNREELRSIMVEFEDLVFRRVKA